ncbi:hypothetical protein [Desulfotalea psychrophila]|uniref:Outer-membrane lipoprotein LolB n=1 Tax=Desulfotalea psychrophila (strain LSv54 / DSM 12343) TaxID=177439 RepID=Q6AJE0_DESPS|nr:hypothetical protein [Desulfotalea psychrophila]CAG37540.1 unknown protein [Desulfotalea psychrophila LSv54]
MIFFPRLPKSSILFCLLLPLLLSSCSSVPWQSKTLILKLDPAYEEYQRQFADIQRAQRAINPSFDAEARIEITSSLKNKKFAGYLAILSPSYIKFVLSSPLGQPLVVATGDGQNWQTINTQSKSYQRDKISQFLRDQDLPKEIAQIGLANILSAQIGRGFNPPWALKDDKKNRGIWYAPLSGTTAEHILVDYRGRKIIGRTIGSTEKQQIVILYDDWTVIDGYEIPSLITISGLSYGAEIKIILTEIIAQPRLQKTSFQIVPPPGFRQSS